MLTSNVHSSTIEKTNNLPMPAFLEVNAGSVSITPENVTIVPGESNRINVNVTVYTESGNLSSMLFELATQDNYQNCMANHGTSCIAYRNVDNDSLTFPVRAGSVYYFVFDNTGSSISKKCALQVSVLSVGIENTVSKDGSFNFAGLGLAFVGGLIAVYGVTRKTVIPWE